MTTRASLFVLSGAAIGFALGVFVTCLLTPSDGPTLHPATDATVASEHPTPVPHRSVEGSSTTAGQSSGGMAEFTASLDALPPAALLTGDGRVTGVVVSRATGDPIAGARLLLDLGDGRAGGAPAASSDDAELLAWVRDVRTRRDWRREALSAADGSFVFENLPDSTFHLTAEKTGWGFGAAGVFANIFSSPVKPGAHIRFEGEPRVPVRCVVLKPDGSLTDSASIDFRQPGTSMTYHWERGDPPDDMQLRPGTWIVSANRRDESSILVSAPREVELRAAGTAEITFQLREDRAIAVTLTGAALDHYEEIVEVVCVECPVRPTPAQLEQAPRRAGWGGTSWSLWSAPRDGDPDPIVFDGLGDGNWWIAAWTGFGAVSEIREIGRPAGLVRQVLEVGPPPRGSFVAVTVLGPEGSIIDERLSFMAGARFEGGGEHLIHADAFAAGDGVWYVPHDDPRGRMSQAIPIVGVSCDSGEVSAAYAPGPDARATLRLDEPATLVVEIPGITDREISRTVSMKLVPSEDVYESGAGFTMVEAGRWSSEAVQPGAYTLVIDDRKAEHDFPVEMRSGRNLIEIELPECRPLSVRFPREHAGEHVNLEGRIDRSAQVGANGVALFENVPPGRYRVSRTEYQQMIVEAPASHVMDFEPLELRAILVRLWRTASLPVVNGDLIIGIGDAEFENQGATLSGLGRLLRMRGAELLIVRKGRRMRVRVYVPDLDRSATLTPVPR